VQNIDATSIATANNVLATMMLNDIVEYNPPVG
jgi:hypothetical protein